MAYAGGSGVGLPYIGGCGLPDSLLVGAATYATVPAQHPAMHPISSIASSPALTSSKVITKTTPLTPCPPPTPSIVCFLVFVFLMHVPSSSSSPSYFLRALGTFSAAAASTAVAAYKYLYTNASCAAEGVAWHTTGRSSAPPQDFSTHEWDGLGWGHVV